MGDSYHSFNNWLDQKQKMTNNLFFSGGDPNNFAYKLGNFAGNFAGDMAMFGGACRVLKATGYVGKSFLNMTEKLASSRGGVGSKGISTYWNPIHGPGPLDPKVANSFRSSSYREHTLREPVELYRVYSDPSKMLGRFWSRTSPSGPLQSILDHALHPEFGNLATKTVKIRVPAEVTVYEGIVAPQEGLLGGGNQIFLKSVNEKWIVP
jgi:filamentous hemagglutinin